MAIMETTPAVSTNLEAVTDLVMKRQLIDVPRDHVQGIVKMVLECAAEAAGPVEPAYSPSVRRLDVTVLAVDTLGSFRSFNDHVSYVTGWDGSPSRQGSAYGPPRNEAGPTRLTEALLALVGHDVALWVTDDQFYAQPTILTFNDLGKSE